MNQRVREKQQEENTDKKPETGTDVAAGAPGTDVAAAAPGTGVTVYDFGDDAGAGMEDVKREEYKIPFLVILDPKSPQCKPPSAGGLPGAKGGALYNTATGEVFDGERGLDFVPVARAENYPEFLPRNDDGSGGGFVGIRSPDDELVKKLREKQGAFGKLKNTEADPPTEIVQTYYLYGLMINPNDGSPSPVMIGFKSTQIKKYQGFITRTMSIQYPTNTGMVKPPLWAHVWHLSTVYESKAAFNWFGWVLRMKEEPSNKSLLKTSDPLYLAGKDLAAAVKQGTKTADFEAAAKVRQSGDDHSSNEIPM